MERITPRTVNDGHSVQYIKARLVKSGRTVEVDDLRQQIGILRCYNPWHYDREGNLYHDNDLLFMEPRLQS